MELLKQVANISGKSGLYKIIKPTRSGVIVETIDEVKGRSVVGANSRVSVLKEISVYTETNDGAVSLEEVLASIHEKYGKPLDIDTKTATTEELAAFFGGVVPEYDRERVYASDIKKIINWYTILVKYLPELFENTSEEAQEVAKAEE